MEPQVLNTFKISINSTDAMLLYLALERQITLELKDRNLIHPIMLQLDQSLRSKNDTLIALNPNQKKLCIKVLELSIKIYSSKQNISLIESLLNKVRDSN